MGRKKKIDMTVEIELEYEQVKFIIKHLENQETESTNEARRMNEIISLMKERVEEIIQSQPDFYLDKKNSLEERWNGFCYNTNVSKYIPRIKTSFSDNLVDEFWHDGAGEYRNGEFSLVEEISDLDQSLQGNMYCKWTREQVNEMMEAVMEKGYTDFIWDW